VATRRVSVISQRSGGVAERATWAQTADCIAACSLKLGGAMCGHVMLAFNIASSPSASWRNHIHPVLRNPMLLAGLGSPGTSEAAMSLPAFHSTQRQLITDLESGVECNGRHDLHWIAQPCLVNVGEERVVTQ